VKNPTDDDLRHLLTVRQALRDTVRFIRYRQEQLGCSRDRTSPSYCPVVAVGASYAGFLSVLMRFLYPDVVDVAYGSSVSLRAFSDGQLDSHKYFESIARVPVDGSNQSCDDAGALLSSIGSRVLLTGGDSDVLSSCPFTNDRNLNIKFVSFPAAPPSSDLTIGGQSLDESSNLQESHFRIESIIGYWLSEIQEERYLEEEIEET